MLIYSQRQREKNLRNWGMKVKVKVKRRERERERDGVETRRESSYRQNCDCKRASITSFARYIIYYQLPLLFSSQFFYE